MMNESGNAKKCTKQRRDVILEKENAGRRK